MILARKFARLAFAAAFSAAGATAVLAHAHLVRAVPGVGSTVKIAPSQVQIFFSEAVEPAFSTVEVLDPKGNRVDQGKAAVDPADAKVLSIALKPMTPGSYKVMWRVVSVDSHKTNGSFGFTVAP
jgi:methionine-rich copper-binding protein CopC